MPFVKHGLLQYKLCIEPSQFCSQSLDCPVYHATTRNIMTIEVRPEKGFMNSK